MPKLDLKNKNNQIYNFVDLHVVELADKENISVESIDKDKLIAESITHKSKNLFKLRDWDSERRGESTGVKISKTN